MSRSDGWKGPLNRPVLPNDGDFNHTHAVAGVINLSTRGTGTGLLSGYKARGIDFINTDEVNAAIVTINGVTSYVLPGGAGMCKVFSPFDTVYVSGSTEYHATTQSGLLE